MGSGGLGGCDAHASEPGGADFAVIACNTAHAYLDELRWRVDGIRLLDSLEVIAAAAIAIAAGHRTLPGSASHEQRAA